MTQSTRPLVAAYEAAEPPPRSLFRRPRVAGVATVGVLSPSYGMERVSYMIPSSHHRYVALYQLRPRMLDRHGSTFMEQTPLVVGANVDLLHTFNQIPVNRNFVVTAEMELPRYLGRTRPWQLQVGLRLLSTDRCRAILPLSEAARAFIARRFEQAGYRELCDKMTVFRGAVLGPPTATRAARAADSGDLRLLFVGGDGLRKGLGPTLDAAQALRRGGVDVRLTVVSQPKSTTYVAPGIAFPTEHLSAVLSGEEWITHYPSVPNAQVRCLMESHDILVLPTMDESLGWAVAEAGISGMPAIATNVFAIPEMIISGKTGWTIELPLDEDRRWLHIGRRNVREQWDAAQEHLTVSLVRVLSAMAGNRAAVAEFGARAREHITRLYGVESAEPRLRRVYGEALAKGRRPGPESDIAT